MLSPEADLRLPRVEYTSRLAQRRGVAERAKARYRMVGSLRIAVFVIELILAGLAFGVHLLSPWWLIAPLVIFGVLLIWHEHVGRAMRRADRAACYYDKGLARLDHRWSGTGQPGTRFLDETHPCALDLDLFGTGSLYELLCTARTSKGEDTLAEWLLAPAAADEIAARHGAVADLRPRLDLREELAMLGTDVPTGVDLNGLLSWASGTPILQAKWPRVACLLFVAGTVTTLVGWLEWEFGIYPLLIALLLQGAFAFWLSGSVQQVINPIEKRAKHLAVFAAILHLLETRSFSAAKLKSLKSGLDSYGIRPSRRIAQLGRLIEWLNARMNPFFAPFAPLFLWTTQIAYAVESWRAKVGPVIERWLVAVGEVEALSSFAAYSYENPADPFPMVEPEGALLEGEELGHPLIPPDRCVRNSLRLATDPQMLVVSGSNMSGKSTFLRTVGVNAVLALAGAPVRATRLRIAPLVVGATLRIQDSLQAGRSRFYAEIVRVRQLVDLARGPLPLLFLLDELFQGTNSHDRRLGADAVVRSLIELKAMGLITTHDLALTQIADQLAPSAANVHFEDHFENGNMVFDYHMRPGIVQKSNALELMRAVGIEV